MDSKQNFRLGFLSNVGYFYFGFILLMLIGFSALLVYIVFSISDGGGGSLIFKLLIPIAVIGWGILKGFFKALFSKLPEPEGFDLNRKDYPEFYKILDDICKKSDCPDIHGVKLDFDSNAFIVEQPTLGILGRYKRYLVIGLPLLLMLDEEELKAVIAHECGHLSKSHSKDSLKIYRAKLIWDKIMEELKKSEKDRTFFIRIFIQRYIPTLNDLMFKMSKEYEYQADRIAKSVAGGEAFAKSLVKMNIYDFHLQNSLWNEVYNLNREKPNPPQDLFFRMEKAISIPVDKEASENIIKGMISYRSLPNSTHPSFIERIEALECNVPEFTDTSSSSLRQIFEDSTNLLLKKCSETWADESTNNWKNYYSRIKEEHERLQFLNEKYLNNELLEDEHFERIFLIEDAFGIEKALSAFEELKTLKPDDIYVKYNIGRLKLKQNIEEGVGILEDVMEKECQLIPESCNDIVNYYCFNGERDKAAEYYHYAVEFMNTNEEVKEEREILKLDDTFISHDLSYDTIIKLREFLMAYSEIKKAYVIIKHAKLSSQFPIYVIGVAYGKASKRRRNEIHEELINSQLLPWEYWVDDLNIDKELGYIFDEISECRII